MRTTNLEPAHLLAATLLLPAYGWGNDFDNPQIVASGDVFTLTPAVTRLPRSRRTGRR